MQAYFSHHWCLAGFFIAGFLPFDLPMTNAQSQSVLFVVLVVDSPDETEAKAEVCINPPDEIYTGNLEYKTL